MNEKKIYRYGDMLHMPRGIEMKGYYHSDGSITYIGQYLQPNGQPNARPKRVYRIEVYYGDEIWCADISEDHDILASITADKKWNAAYAALGALHGILHRRCVQTSVNRRARRHAAESAAGGAVGTPRPTGICQERGMR